MPPTASLLAAPAPRCTTTVALPADADPAADQAGSKKTPYLSDLPPRESGSYWSATMSDHVIYESRLELARLLYADFDRAVQSISAQPFLLNVQIEGQLRRHVPDFLLVTDTGPIVVDVKPRQYLSKEKTAFTLAWCRAAVEDRGWEYEVWSEPPEAELANLRLLAGYRRKWLFDRSLLDALIGADLDGARVRDVPAVIAEWPRRLVWAHLLHLIWSHNYSADLSTVLSGDHVLAKEAS